MGPETHTGPKNEGPVPLSNTMLLETASVSLPNSISFHPTPLTSRMYECDGRHTHRQTDRQTDHATVTSVTIGGIAFSDAD